MGAGGRVVRGYRESMGGPLTIRAMVVQASSRLFVTGCIALGGQLQVESVVVRASQRIYGNQRDPSVYSVLRDSPLRIDLVLRLLPLPKNANGIISFTPAARTSSVALFQVSHGHEANTQGDILLTSLIGSGHKLCRLVSLCFLGPPLNSIDARTWWCAI
jgi:hypothetical protein